MKLYFQSKQKRIAQIAFNSYFGIILQDLVDFISLECVISLREAFFFALNSKLKMWQTHRVWLLSIFSKTHRYLAKRNMQRFVLHQGPPNLRIWAKLNFELLPRNV